MTTPATGRFFAVGVGPGDPELLTLKALAIIQKAQVIYHAGPAADRGRALDIVRRWLKPEQELAVVRDQAMPDIRGYRDAAERIAADCRAGKDVVFITEGDPTLYSTASPIWQELAQIAPDIAIEVVPGVSSITAAAAKVGWPLAQKDETVAIVPAHYHGEELAGWIERAATTVFLKPANALADLVRTIGGRQAVYVENLGTDREWITQDLSSAKERREYFSLVLVRRAGTDRRKAERANLCVVGIGPGVVDLLTIRGRQALETADVLIGYEGYLRHLEPLHLKAERLGSPIGAEEGRARQALELARAGKRVALVSSGDAGVYGMASLLLETATEDVAVEIIPGVTAAAAAAALLGAPLGHDFACISLSDLLTPWAVIEQRLAAAAQGDFVIALYNPTSQKRTWQLGQAREIILKHRQPDTPVGIVDRAFRDGQSVRITTLPELSTDGIGMETILVIGSSQTKVLHGKMITPRGYSSIRNPQSAIRNAPRSQRGNKIMSESFAIIERELGPHDFPPWLFAVVRRMVHATADFDFARIIRHSPGFDEAFRAAWQSQAPMVTDVEMVRLGIASTWPGLTIRCHLNDAEAGSLAEAENLTRTAAGIRLAAKQHAHPILVIGNAPTAIDEALRLVEAGVWQPSAILGLPVGFVGVLEAKGRLLAQSRLPYLTCEGRKGGSAVAAAAANALLDWVQHEP